jgi:hypothetical protein
VEYPSNKIPTKEEGGLAFWSHRKLVFCVFQECLYFHGLLLLATRAELTKVACAVE